MSSQVRPSLDSVKGDFNRHESLDGWEIVVNLSKHSSTNQRPKNHKSNQSEDRKLSISIK